MNRTPPRLMLLEADARLRKLERAAATGDVHAAFALVKAKQRRGEWLEPEDWRYVFMSEIGYDPVDVDLEEFARRIIKGKVGRRELFLYHLSDTSTSTRMMSGIRREIQGEFNKRLSEKIRRPMQTMVKRNKKLFGSGAVVSVSADSGLFTYNTELRVTFSKLKKGARGSLDLDKVGMKLVAVVKKVLDGLESTSDDDYPGGIETLLDYTKYWPDRDHDWNSDRSLTIQLPIGTHPPQDDEGNDQGVVVTMVALSHKR